GELLNKAKLAKHDLKNALSILRHDDEDFSNEVFLTSALEKTGLDDILNYLSLTHKKLVQSGAIDKKRLEQTKSWFDKLIIDSLYEDFLQNKKVKIELDQKLNDVLESKSSILKAVQ